jgi:hypothetical protein
VKKKRYCSILFDNSFLLKKRGARARKLRIVIWTPFASGKGNFSCQLRLDERREMVFGSTALQAVFIAIQQLKHLLALKEQTQWRLYDIEDQLPVEWKTDFEIGTLETKGAQVEAKVVAYRLKHQSKRRKK